jgi:hypothetical protein
MAGDIQRIETNYRALLEAVPYLDSAEIRGASEVTNLLRFSNLSPPAATVVFNGERARPDAALGDITVQESEMEWSIFITASSFGIEGEGRSGDVGIYQMIDDVLEAVNGKLLTVTPTSVAYYVSSRRFDLSANNVTYEMVFRNAYIRAQ